VLAEISTSHNNVLIDSILAIVRRDRDGEQVSQTEIKAAVNSLVHVNCDQEEPLKLYVELFEDPYVKQTTDYYTQESIRAIQSLSVSEFMQNATRRIQEEDERISKFCNNSSMERVFVIY
jgi:cullin 2